MAETCGRRVKHSRILETESIKPIYAHHIPLFVYDCGLPLRFACAVQADKAAFISVPQNGHIFVPSLSCSLHFGHNIINIFRYMRTVPLNCHGIPKRTSDMSKYQHRAHNGNYTEYQPYNKPDYRALAAGACSHGHGVVPHKVEYQSHYRHKKA